MSVKSITLATAIIAAPIGINSAMAMKNKNAESTTMQKTYDYQLSAQDYKTYVFPQIAGSPDRITQVLNLTQQEKQEIVNKILNFSEKESDSFSTVISNKVFDSRTAFLDSMDSISANAEKGIALINSQQSDKTTDLDKVLVNADTTYNNISKLYRTLNQIDVKANGPKANKLNAEESSLQNVAEETLGMDLDKFRKTYKNELISLKNKTISTEQDKSKELTENELFVLDKISALESNFAKFNIEQYKNASDHAQERKSSAEFDIYSALTQLVNFIKDKDSNFDISKFLQNETRIVAEPFAEELVNLHITKTGNIHSANKASLNRKIVRDGKVVIEVTNPKQGNVETFETNGNKIK